MARPKPEFPWVQRTVSLQAPVLERVELIAAREGVSTSRLLRMWVDAMVAIDEATGLVAPDGPGAEVVHVRNGEIVHAE